ncbi:uncharacterized protein EURHEDRAFT_445672, partial [Aspergillus ruber CBS 135680]
WSTPELKPYGPLSFLPSASCIHYTTECFEVLKAYHTNDGKPRLFRADHNAFFALLAQLQLKASHWSRFKLSGKRIELLWEEGKKEKGRESLNVEVPTSNASKKYPKKIP